MPTNEETAWAAGLFEGEGCFSIHGKTRARASMSSTDRDVLEKFVEIVKCGSVWFINRGNQKPHHKDTYQWSVNGEDCVHVFNMLKPFLCARRLHRGQEVIDIWMASRAAHCAERSCKRCDILFTPKIDENNPWTVSGASRQSYCTIECRNIAKNERRRERHATVRIDNNHLDVGINATDNNIKTCQHCLCAYVSQTGMTYCSYKCRGDGMRKTRLTKTCEQCGDVYDQKKRQTVKEFGTRRYCGLSCASQANAAAVREARQSARS